MSKNMILKTLAMMTFKERALTFDNMVYLHPEIRLKQEHPNAQLPRKGHDNDACFDLYTVESKILEPGERYAFPTGWSMEMPEYLEATIRPRSGLAINSGVTVLNSPGTIDSSYRGEIKVILINHDRYKVLIEAGARIAQMKFDFVIPVMFEIVRSDDSLGETERGAGGFGSTGTR